MLAKSATDLSCADKRDNYLTAWLIGFLLLVGCWHTSVSAELWQPVETIRQTALQTARAKLKTPDAQNQFSVGVLDSRHRLPLCDRPLQGFLLPNTKIQKDTVVGVRCTGGKPWKVYVPIRIQILRQVFVTTRPVPRGTKLSAKDVRLTTKDVSGTDYVTDVQDYDKTEAARDLPAGVILRRKMLKATVLVKKGQSVTLLSKIRGLSVRVSGQALQNGALNQRIRVKNTESERELEGIVRSQQIVEVML